ncbi:hypothetical protein RDWZM_004698 [Blomia tropicalis]|uniref:G-protein coupled receptors family 1 profile domain-containing protein n=1 Tax=Blomia tropicalis TaxID=40697 RepID=A0A9Q0RLM9_BLOTA|nr:hypothetical protein RDWZM_004698 [Blomia tropicalis]
MESYESSSNEPFNMTHLAIQANETLKELLEFEDQLDSFMGNMTGPTESLYTALEFSKIFHYMAAIFGVIGNLLVIIVYLRNTRIRNVTNTYIVNVAISDLLYVITVPVFLISIWSNSWPFGEFVCKLLLSKGAIHRFASSLFLLVLMVDTYLSILKPNLSHLCYRKPFSTQMICALTWIICILSVGPVFYHASTFAVPNSDINHCDLFWTGPSREAYIWFTIVIAFIIPTLIKILLSVPLIYTLAGGSNGENVSEGQYQVFAERNKRSAHLILTIIMFHILCWLPLWISLISVNLLPMNEMPDNSAILFHMISGCLGMANTVLNPFIYFKLSNEFRTGLNELIQSFNYYYCSRSTLFHHSSNDVAGITNGTNGTKSANGIGGDDTIVNNFFPSNVFQHYDEERNQRQQQQQQQQESTNVNQSNTTQT